MARVLDLLGGHIHENCLFLAVFILKLCLESYTKLPPPDGILHGVLHLEFIMDL